MAQSTGLRHLRWALAMPVGIDRLVECHRLGPTEFWIGAGLDLFSRFARHIDSYRSTFALRPALGRTAFARWARDALGTGHERLVYRPGGRGNYGASLHAVEAVPMVIERM